MSKKLAKVFSVIFSGIGCVFILWMLEGSENPVVSQTSNNNGVILNQGDGGQQAAGNIINNYGIGTDGAGETFQLSRDQTRILGSRVVLTFRGRGCANRGYIAITLAGERDNCVAPGEVIEFESNNQMFDLTFLEANESRTVAEFYVAAH